MTDSDTTPRTLTAERLTSALDEVGGLARPGYLPDIVARARRTRQRPAWTFFERWPPMDIAARRQGVPRAVLVFAALALLIALLVASVAFIGGRRAQPALTAATNGLIAFASGTDIMVVQPDGTGRRTLVDGSDAIDSMAYSPDGGRLAYWAQAAAVTSWNLVVVDADGSDPVTIASGVLALTTPHIAWSPDGATIAYSGRTTVFDFPSCQAYENGDFCGSRIFVANTDGSSTRQIGDPDLDARSPDWSPDGSTIAFGGGNASPAIGVRLYLMDADGKNVRQLSDVHGSDWAFVRVDWSHDGTKIVGQAGAADDIRNWDIRIIDADAAARPTWGHVPPAATRSSRAGRRTGTPWPGRRTASSSWRTGPNRSTSRRRRASPSGRRTAGSSQRRPTKACTSWISRARYRRPWAARPSARSASSPGRR